MGLDSFKGGTSSDKKGIKWEKDKLNKDYVCPQCGGTDTEHIRGNEWRCLDYDNCDVITYRTNDHYTDLL